MTHVLVQWTTERSWDVYPVRAIVDTALGLQLLNEEGAIGELRNEVIIVNWKAGEAPAPAKLLDFGTERAMERRRTKLAKSGPQHRRGEGEPVDELRTEKHPGAYGCGCRSARRVAELEFEVKELQKRLGHAENNYNSYQMVKRLKK
ncbi:uncharacterized protein LOC135365733 [Ornithodoros turicata]|uniref:uncharacterized protein LOC135365733 n=1 Tax=Ornithodoros turicata TaxID=34597 RepID=UPI0031389AED